MNAEEAYFLYGTSKDKFMQAYAKGYLEAVEKAERAFDDIADGISTDDHSRVNRALDKWEKEK